MNIQKDGSFNPVLQLMTNFKIPKKAQKQEETMEIVEETRQGDAENVPEEKPHEFEASKDHLETSEGATKHEPVSTQKLQELEALTMQVTGNSLKRKPNIDEDLRNEMFNASMPEELKQLFDREKCSLCNATLQTIVSAKAHYTSKKHMKNVRNFLMARNINADEPAMKKFKKEDSEWNGNNKAERAIHGPYFCNICCIPLTGEEDSRTHYQGKKHKKAEAAAIEGIPQRVIGDDSFGIQFRLGQFIDDAIGQTNCSLCNISASSAQTMQAHLQGKRHRKNLAAQAARGAQAGGAGPQAEGAHAGGAQAEGTQAEGAQAEGAHSGGAQVGGAQAGGAQAEGTQAGGAQAGGAQAEGAAGAQAGGAQTEDLQNNESASSTTVKLESHLPSPLPNKQQQQQQTQIADSTLAEFRTPSGQYYCQYCNKSMNSNRQFGEHLQSKAHQKKNAMRTLDPIDIKLNEIKQSVMEAAAAGSQQKKKNPATNDVL